MSNNHNGVLIEYSIWCFVPLAVLLPLGLGRAAIRFQAYGRFYEDDIAGLLGVACTIGAACIFFTQWNDLEAMFNTVPKNSTNLFDFAVFGALYAFRFSALFLYRDVFWPSRAFRKVWYAVLAYLIGSGFATVGLLGSLPAPSSSVPPHYESNKVDFGGPLMVSVWLYCFGTLAVVLIPLVILPEIHLRRSVNLGLTLVLATAYTGIALTIVSFAVDPNEPARGFFSTLGIYMEAFAVQLVAYTPLAIAEERQKLWPWSRPGKQVDGEMQREAGARKPPAIRVLKAGIFGSLKTPVQRDSSSNSDTIEMHSLSSRASIDDVKTDKNAPVSSL